MPASTALAMVVIEVNEVVGSSVRSRPLDMIDDENLTLNHGWFEFQAELFLERCEQNRDVAERHRRTPGRPTRMARCREPPRIIRLAAHGGLT
jgi:hypothetical protein